MLRRKFFFLVLDLSDPVHEADGQRLKKKKCFIYDTGGETYDRGEALHWDIFMTFSNAPGPLQCCTWAIDTMNITFKSQNNPEF